jgi:hypothetical protein
MIAPEMDAAPLIERGYAVYDERGIPILPGDTVRVFHYTAARRREKRYMFKYATQIVWRAADKCPLLQLRHLNVRDEWFFQIMDGRKKVTKSSRLRGRP